MPSCDDRACQVFIPTTKRFQDEETREVEGKNDVGFFATREEMFQKGLYPGVEYR